MKIVMMKRPRKKPRNNKEYYKQNPWDSPMVFELLDEDGEGKVIFLSYAKILEREMSKEEKEKFLNKNE